MTADERCRWGGSESASTSSCVRGCVMYRYHLDECEGATDGTCRGCLPRRATNGLLCHTCHRRFELMMHDAPTVYRWLTGNLTAGEGAARAKDDYERGGAEETPTPLKVAVLDVRDLLADQLAELTDEVCETHRLSGPGRHTVTADAEFLLRFLHTIECEEWVGDWWQTLAETMSQAHALAPWRPAVRRVPGVPCPGCAETNLVIYGGETDISCQSCHIVMTEARFGLWEAVLKQDQEAS